MESVLLLSFVTVILPTPRITANNYLDPLSDEFIDSINSEQSLWKAGRNFRKDIPVSYIRNLMGRLTSDDQPKLPVFQHNLEGIEIPDSFDWRDHFPECPTLRNIRDQGSCGSCWAISAAAVMSDRICIRSKGKQNVYVSENDIVACCNKHSKGCGGGFEIEAFDYWEHHGIVSGGPYGSKQGCQPYEIPPCEHGTVEGPRPRCSEMKNQTPKCVETCISGYSKSYKKDLHFANSSYTLLRGDVKQIQTDIMINGPVTAAFDVYEDLIYVFKSGIYKHVKGSLLGKHAVKMIGWGVENDTPYWLIANSWNTDWGDKGYFRILRGENHCGIEEDIAAGNPLLD